MTSRESGLETQRLASGQNRAWRVQGLSEAEGAGRRGAVHQIARRRLSSRTAASFRAASFRAVGVKPTRGALVYSKRTLPSPVTLNAAFTVAAVEQAANARQRTRTA